VVERWGERERGEGEGEREKNCCYIFLNLKMLLNNPLQLAEG